jgi:GT2 family glycosyltransferase
MSSRERELGPISVVVCNYNGEAYLDECLAAVRASNGGVDEILVVDNASTDRSLAILAERHPDVRLIRLARNDGPCPARNAGMRAARNRWVLALDNDAVVRPGTIDELALAVVRNADAQSSSAARVAIVQPRSLFHADPARVHYDGGSFHYAGLIALRNSYRSLTEAEGRGVVPVDCAVAVALLVDRDILLGVGGYDERFFILFEDLDLSYRLRARGHSILSAEDAIVLHKGGTPGISYREGPRYPASRVLLHSQNRWMFLAKNYRAWTLVAASPGIFAYELVWFGFAVASGGCLAWARGKRRFLAALPRILAERRVLQRERTVSDGALLRGGPLTITPMLAARPLKRASIRALDLVLRSWWAAARWLVP